MAERFVDIAISDHQTLRAAPDHNPLRVNSGDQVSWRFFSATGAPLNAQAQSLRVVFQAFLPTIDRFASFTGPGKDPFNGSIQPSGGNLVGVIADPADDGLYVYSIFNGEDQELKWETTAFSAGNYEAFFGTIVKPSGPPTTTGGT